MASNSVVSLWCFISYANIGENSVFICVRDGRGRLQAILQQKAPLDLVEEEECTGTLELIVRDAHVDNAILADEVDQVVAVRVRQFVVVCRNGFDDLLGDLGKVADALGIFGQHNGPARYYTV